MKKYLVRLDEAQNHHCCYCGLRMEQQPHVNGWPSPPDIPTKDHIEPRTYGGQTDLDNLVVACRQCNNLRGEMDAVAFYNLLQKWLRRDPALRTRWHSLTKPELAALKVQCYEVHAASLQGRARRHKEFAFRHTEFSFRQWQYKLWQLARARPI